MPPRSLARQILSFIPVAIFGICATGCTLFDEFFDESVSLAEFAPVSAHVTVELADVSRSQLVLEGKEGMCPTMKDDIEARVDDKPMDVFIRGGQQPNSQGGWICGMPTFRRNVASSDLGKASTRFIVEDDTKTITVEATGLLQERTIAPTVKDVPIEAGVETSFDWSVATDEIDPELLLVDFVYDDAALSLSSTAWTRVDGSLVHIRLPADAPAGKGMLQVEVTANVPVEKCDGVPACDASVHARAEVELEVVASKPPNP
ncbi:MAG: hypothetical protein IPM54_07805 [Polyangiaceae bacterium]|nr:hypothetical protein [Polyangiaceae bacterium]